MAVLPSERAGAVAVDPGGGVTEIAPARTESVRLPHDRAPHRPSAAPRPRRAHHGRRPPPRRNPRPPRPGRGAQPRLHRRLRRVVAPDRGPDSPRAGRHLGPARPRTLRMGRSCERGRSPPARFRDSARAAAAPPSPTRTAWHAPSKARCESISVGAIARAPASPPSRQNGSSQTSRRRAWPPAAALGATIASQALRRTVAIVVVQQFDKSRIRRVVDVDAHQVRRLRPNRRFAVLRKLDQHRRRRRRAANYIRSSPRGYDRRPNSEGFESTPSGRRPNYCPVRP